MLVTATGLIFIGLPSKNEESPRFMKLGAALKFIRVVQV